MNHSSITLNYPLYSKETGILSNWNENSRISVAIDFDEKSCLISGNKEGLLSLAQHLVSLAQDGAPIGSHFHFDEFNGMDKNSVELILEKI